MGQHLGGWQFLEIGARGQRDATQVREAADVIRLETGLLVQPAVVRHPLVGVAHQRAQPPALKGSDLFRAPSGASQEPLAGAHPPRNGPQEGQLRIIQLGKMADWDSFRRLFHPRRILWQNRSGFYCMGLEQFCPISVVACLYLMLQLPGITWKRFAIWLAVGFVLYFFYGVRHSRLRNRAAA